MTIPNTFNVGSPIGISASSIEKETLAAAISESEWYRLNRMSEYDRPHVEVALGYAIRRDPVKPSFGDVFTMRCVEPAKRNKDGVRWVSHRFPIKGGISHIEAMRRDAIEVMSKPSLLFLRFASALK